MKRVVGLEDIVTHRHSVTEGVVEFPPEIDTVKLMSYPRAIKKGIIPPIPFLAWRFLNREGFIADVDLPIHSLHQISVVAFWPLPSPGH